MPNIKHCIESQLKRDLKRDSNGIGVMSIRALCSPPEGYAPAPVLCPIWGMTGKYGRYIYRAYMSVPALYGTASLIILVFPLMVEAFNWLFMGWASPTLIVKHLSSRTTTQEWGYHIGTFCNEHA
jgi:hypothetical protein